MNTTEKIQTYLNDPKIVSVNTVDAHSDHKYFESLAEFSEGEMKLRQSLNGKWKIHYAQNTNQVLKDFLKSNKNAYYYALINKGFFKKKELYLIDMYTKNIYKVENDKVVNY